MHFTCKADGYQSDTFRYQWRLNQDDIDGATDKTYIISSVNETDRGMYECVVTNHWNEEDTSDPVQLNVTSMAFTIFVCMYASPKHMIIYIVTFNYLSIYSNHLYMVVTYI